MIELVVILVVIGVALWAINTYIPLAQPIRSIINVVVVLGVCLYLLRFFGVLTGSWRGAGRLP